MFDWTPSLEIGVDEIDAQHRALFELAGEFAVAVRDRRIGDYTRR
jgi:hemerythrin